MLHLPEDAKWQTAKQKATCPDPTCNPKMAVWLILPEMELGGIGFSLEFLRIHQEHFYSPSSSNRLDADGSGGLSSWQINKLAEA